MNDRFKFRMYDTNVNKMYMPNDFGGVESIYECLKQQINWDLDVDYDIKFNHLKDGRFFMQCTGLKDKNGLENIYEYDIINIDGIKIGNIYEQEDLLKDTTNFVIKRMGTKEWRDSEQEAIKRGCYYAE